MHCISPYSYRMRENTDQKNFSIWTLFTQCNLCLLNLYIDTGTRYLRNMFSISLESEQKQEKE